MTFPSGLAIITVSLALFLIVFVLAHVAECNLSGICPAS